MSKQEEKIGAINSDEQIGEAVGDGRISYNRLVQVILTSVVGIVVNVLLGVLKIIVGLAANSIAVISDAVNNFSDSVSSIVTIIAMAMVGKGATKKHPFGFGRVEYFSSLLISVLVLFTGGQFMVSSVKKIIHPEPTAYTTISLAMLAVAIIAKILLGFYTKSRGKKYNSPSLAASGQDALSDAVITGVTLIAALISLSTDLIIDGWVGALVSLFVLKAGVEILLDVISKLMGDRPSADFTEDIMREIRETPGIVGAYDLILHNYGPNIFIGNVNVELDEEMTIREAYQTIRPLSAHIFNKYGVFFYFGFYSVNMRDEDVRAIREKVTELMMADEDVLQIHAFYVDPVKKAMNFDVVIDFSVKDTMLKAEKLRRQVKEIYPDYEIMLLPDRDYTLSKDSEE